MQPPDRSDRRVVDSTSAVLEPPRTATPDPAPGPDASAPDVPDVPDVPWQPPSQPPSISSVVPLAPPTVGSTRRLRWPERPLQRYSAAIGLVLASGAFAALIGLGPSDSSDAMGDFGAYLTVLVLGIAGAIVSVVSAGSRPADVRASDAGDEIVFRVVFGALVALLLVVLLQSDTQNVANADGQTAYLWAIIGGFGERLSRRFVSGPPRRP